MSARGGFQLPSFYSYPPYFTLQPVKESREKQIGLWHDLLLGYCRYHRICIIPALATEQFPLFVNKEINPHVFTDFLTLKFMTDSGSLSQDAINTVLSAAVTAGRAEWVDGTRQHCIIYWRPLEEWANLLYTCAQSTGLSDVVMTVDELSSGTETKGTDLEGAPKELLTRAIAVLEKTGKARLFKGESGDDDGVKFFT